MFNFGKYPPLGNFGHSRCLIKSDIILVNTLQQFISSYKLL